MSVRSGSSTLIMGVVIYLLGMTFSDVYAEPWSGEQSERNLTVTLQGASYLPEIDNEFVDMEGAQRPYERVFGNQSPTMFSLLVDRHFYQGFGVISGGVGFGYWNVEGESESEEASAETTEMTINPMSVHLSYRFDLFQKYLPIVPHFRGGLSYFSWTIYKGNGDVATFDTGEEASGGTLGWHYAVGAQFLLDALDREMAWAFDRDAGVNHSYFTVEYQVARVDDFADPDSFRLGNTSVFFGLALDI